MVRPSVTTPGRRPAEPPLLAGRDAVAVAMAFAELEFRDSLTEMDSRFRGNDVIFSEPVVPARTRAASAHPVHAPIFPIS